MGYRGSKFDGVSTEIAWHISLDGGPEDELGDVESFGWYGIMRITPGETDEWITRAKEDIGGLSNEEIAEAKSEFGGAVGIILYNNNLGFVYGELFTNADELEAKWNEIVEEYEESEGGEDVDEEEEELGDDEEEEEELGDDEEEEDEEEETEEQ